MRPLASVLTVCAALALGGCATSEPPFAKVGHLDRLVPKLGIFAVDGGTQEQFQLQYELTGDEWAAARGLSTAALTAPAGSFLIWADPAARGIVGGAMFVVQILTVVPDSGDCRVAAWAVMNEVHAQDQSKLLADLDGHGAGVTLLSSVAKRDSVGMWYTQQDSILCPSTKGGEVYAPRDFYAAFATEDARSWILAGRFEPDPAWVAAATKDGALTVKTAPAPSLASWSGPYPVPAPRKAELASAPAS